MKRMEFCKDNGCNTIMLTGNSEPQQNRVFLQKFGTMNNNLSQPFRWIEMQTSGVMLDDPYLRFLRNHVGVSTISLSLSALSDDVNANYNGILPKLKFSIAELCHEIKRYDFNLRLSLNLTDFYKTNGYSDYGEWTPEQIFSHCKTVLGADQVTFRVLYSSDLNTSQDQWIAQHRCPDSKIEEIRDYIQKNGRALERLEFGTTKYSVHGLSVVLDDDCMSTKTKDTLKYLILRQNCKLYSKWDDPASLIF